MQINAQTSKFGKELLEKLKSNQITADEFEKEIAYYAIMTGFNELHYQPAPSKPIKIIEYESLSGKEKEDVSAKFWNDEEVRTYLAQRNSVFSWNRGTKWWLQELLGRFNKYGDTLNANKVRERLGEF